MELLKSWKEAANIPEGWKAAPQPGGCTKVPVHNKGLLKALRQQLPGTWKKVYRKGVDGSEVHYLEHSSGKVCLVKHKIK